MTMTTQLTPIFKKFQLPINSLDAAPPSPTTTTQTHTYPPTHTHTHTVHPGDFSLAHHFSEPVDLIGNETASRGTGMDSFHSATCVCVFVCVCVCICLCVPLRRPLNKAASRRDGFSIL